MAKTKIVNFRLPEEQIDFLQEEADRRSAELGTTQTKTDVLRDTLIEGARAPARIAELEDRIRDLEKTVQKATGKKPAKTRRISVYAADHARIRKAAHKQDMTQAELLHVVLQGKAPLHNVLPPEQARNKPALAAV